MCCRDEASTDQPTPLAVSRHAQNAFQWSRFEMRSLETAHSSVGVCFTANYRILRLATASSASSAAVIQKRTTIFIS